MIFEGLITVIRNAWVIIFWRGITVSNGETSNGFSVILTATLNKEDH